MLEYSEYKSLVDILNQSDLDESYQTLMKKEEKVLDTVNAVVNYYKDKRTKEKQFVHMSLYEIYNLFFLEWPAFLNDVLHVKSMEDISRVIFKGHRVIYIGLLFVITSFILFFVISSK